MKKNPFKGLAYYDFKEDDRARFGGRDQDIATVTNAILRSRTFVLYGRSGLGKSSLMLAGVFPELKLHDCFPIIVRTLQDPMQDLRNAIQEIIPETDNKNIAELIQAVSSANEGRLVVIVFDQFEEFFVRFSREIIDVHRGGSDSVSWETKVKLRDQKNDYIREMGRLVDQAELDVRLVWSLREDWVAEMRDFDSAIPMITQKSHRLLPLTAFGVRQSIQRILRAANIEFEAPVISTLVDTLAEYNFDPAVLQVVCSEVWKQASNRSSEPELLVEDVVAIGGVEGVFQGYLESVTSEIPEENERTRIQVRATLDALVTEKRTKRAMKKSEIRRCGFAIEEDELDWVLDMLERNQLVRSDLRGGETWYELIHERVVDMILNWLVNDVDFFKFRAARNLVENSCRNQGWDENPELLLSKGQIDGTVGPFRQLLHFGERERKFLLFSAIYAQSDHLEFWADAAGLDVTTELLDLFLDNEHEEIRARAIEAAGRISVERERFTLKSLDLAIMDNSSAVRSAAGSSFAKLATDSDFRKLSDHLKVRETRKAATEVLAEVIAAERLSKGCFSRLSLRRARKRLFKRRADATHGALTDRAKKGALTGLLAALAWVSTISVWALLINMEFDPHRYSYDHVLRESLFLFGVFVLCGVPLGTAMGWLIARRATRNIQIKGNEGKVIGTVLSRGWRLFLFLSLFLLLSFPLFSNLPFLGDVHLIFLSIPIWIAVILAWCGWIAGLALPSMRPAGQSLNWVLAWPWAFGGASLLPVLFWSFAPEWRELDRLIGRSFEVSLLMLAISALAGGLVIYVAILTLARTSQVWNRSLEEDLHIGTITANKPKPSMTRHFLGWTMTLATLMLIIHSQGLDWIQPEKILLKPGTHAQTLQFGSGIADTKHLLVELANPERNSSPGLIRLNKLSHVREKGSSSSGQVENSTRLRLNPGSTFLTNSGTVEVAIPRLGNRRQEVSFISSSQESGTSIALGQSHLAAVPIKRYDGNVRFKGDISATFDLGEASTGVLDVVVTSRADCASWSGPLNITFHSESQDQGKHFNLNCLHEDRVMNFNDQSDIQFSIPIGEKVKAAVVLNDRFRLVKEIEHGGEGVVFAGFTSGPSANNQVTKGFPWNPHAAIELCRGTDDAASIISCYADQQSQRVSQRDAIRYCEYNAPRIRAARGTMERYKYRCVDQVLNKIAWDRNGRSTWNPSNAERLCSGTVKPQEPPTCFQRMMQMSNDLTPELATKLDQMFLSDDSNIVIVTALQSNGAIYSTRTTKNARPKQIAPSLDRSNVAMVSSSGELIGTGTATGTVRIASIDVTNTVAIDFKEENEVWGVGFSHDDSKFITASADGKARILGNPFLADSLDEVVELDHGDDVGTTWKAFFSHDDEWIITSHTGGASLWSADGQLQWEYGHPDPKETLEVYWATFSNVDSSLILTAASDGKIRVWERDSPESEPQVLNADVSADDPAWSVAFSHNDDRIAAGFESGTVQVWKSNDNGRYEHEMTIVQGGSVQSVAFGRGSFNQWLVAAQSDGKARVWDLKGVEVPDKSDPPYVFIQFMAKAIPSSPEEDMPAKEGGGRK